MNLFDANCGPRPSYLWRSIWGVQEVIIKVLRWLIGDGQSIDIWEDRWLPHPSTFKVITTKPTPTLPSKVISDLTVINSGCWRKTQVRDLFLQYYVMLI